VGQMAFTHLSTDIGGVLLTNGWDRSMRKEAAQVFNFDYDEMNERHRLTFDIYEEGKLSMAEYLDRTVFYEPRPFTREEFRAYMFSRSQLLPGMFDFLAGLKKRHGLKVDLRGKPGQDSEADRMRERFIHKYG